jgi:hypothetical protein
MVADNLENAFKAQVFLMSLAVALPETASVATAQVTRFPFAQSSLRFTQTTASRFFQDAGSFSGQTIGQMSNALRAGTVNVADVPVQFISKGGNLLIGNTRSALSLLRANVPASE